MVEKNADPSINPADTGGMAGMFNLIMRKNGMKTDDMLPAKVIAFDRASNRAQVQPMVMVLTTANEKVQRAQIASVPVLQIGGGGFMLNFNLNPGDMGWIKASDRDISLFLANGAEDVPNTDRIHSFEDGLFIPNVMTGFAIAGEDEENAVFQNLDGSVRISLWENKIKITAPEIHLDTPLLNMSSGSGDINIGGISFLTHTHQGVQPGGGNTGAPNP